MSAVLSRWVVSIDVPVGPEHVAHDGRVPREILLEWFERAREAYLDGCRSLDGCRGLAGADVGSAVLRVLGEQLVDRRPVTSPDTLLVAATATEIRTTSFDLSCRMRSTESAGAIVAEGRAELAFVDPATFLPVRLPDEVRRELIEREQRATYHV